MIFLDLAQPKMSTIWSTFFYKSFLHKPKSAKIILPPFPQYVITTGVAIKLSQHKCAPMHILGKHMASYFHRVIINFVMAQTK